VLIYIVEDYELKAERIESAVRTVLADARIEVFRSYQSGLKAVLQKQPDLILLDMSLPSFDMMGSARFGRPRSLGGYDLMRKMALKNVTARVFVVTQLDAFGDGTAKVTLKEMTERCHNEFPELFIGSVYFSQTSDDWISKLHAVLEKEAKGLS
jgi:CheY-like chemotaxis protein